MQLAFSSGSTAPADGSHLRPYQAEACEAIDRELAAHRSTLLVLPTGCGKTVVFAEMCRRWCAADEGPVLVLAHREELLEQAREKIERFAGLSVSIDQAERMGMATDVVVGSVQSMRTKRRRRRWSPSAFRRIVVDEAHHAIADSYKVVLDHFAEARVLGVTATPDRGDGAGLARVFESVAYVYELRTAIEAGHLCRIRQAAVDVAGLDLSKVRRVAGDLSLEDLERILTEETALHGIAVPTLELAGDRPTMVFGATVAHAEQLAAVLNRYRPGVAQALSGKTDKEERRRAVQAFSARQFQILVNCALFTEGFDAPLVSCVAVARPTQSRALYAQMVGRGTRTCEGKQDLLFLDFKGNSGRHALVGALDILGEDRVARRAKKLLARRPQLDLLEAMQEAEAELERELQEEMERDRKRREGAKARAVYTVREVDPFAARSYVPQRAGPASDRQLRVLQRYGIDGRGLDKVEASRQISALTRLGAGRNG